MPGETVSDIEIIAFAAGDLSGGDAERVRLHLETHAGATELARLYAAVRETVSTDDSAEPPEQVVARAKSIFKAPAAPSVVDGLCEIVARLVFDSRVQMAAVRDAAAPASFRVTFEADGIEIALEAELMDRSTDTWSVVGQVSSDKGVGPARVEIRSAGSTPLDCATDDRGIFTVVLDAGTYDIEVHFDGTRALVRGIQLG